MEEQIENIPVKKKKSGGKRPGAGRPVSKGDKSKTYCISLYPSEIEKLKNIAQEKDISISQLLRTTFNL